MRAAEFLGLERTDDPTRWRLPVVPSVSSGNGFLFGGCGLAAGIAAMEGTTGRPVVWATAQFLSFAFPPAVLEIDVTEAVRGHQISQARTVARAGDTEILTVNATLGRGPLDLTGEFEAAPQVPPPSQCAPRTYWFDHRGSVMARVDVRLADARDWTDLDGSPGSGRCALWARLPELGEVSAAGLAILGDYVPFGVGQSLGHKAGGNSVDNTLRVATLVPTEWVLLDVRVHAVRNGFGHGLVHLWSEDATLLATASQSCIVRYWPVDREDRRPAAQGEPAPT